jgi:hypothetical protein
LFDKRAALIARCASAEDARLALAHARDRGRSWRPAVAALDARLLELRRLGNDRHRPDEDVRDRRWRSDRPPQRRTDVG